jgi:twinkle protein
MLDKTPGLIRHDQIGYHALADLPQRPSVATIAKSTGWPELDEIFKLYPTQFVMVTGAASHGKSTFLFNLACNVFREHGMKSYFYVPENEDFVRETLAELWGDAPGWEQFSEIGCFVQSSQPEAYDETPKTLQWVLNQAIVAIQEDGARLIIIDPWNELEWSKPKDMSMTEYIGRCLQWLKKFARKYQVTVMLAAHPTKDSALKAKAEGRTVGGYDIDGGANWINKADSVLAVRREEGKPVATIVCSKVRQRGAGKPGFCVFFVDEETGRFRPQPGAVSL